MSAKDGSTTLATVHKIKQQIDRLTEIQVKALKSATFVGMTPDEAQEYDNRLQKIFKLVEQRILLEKSQPVTAPQCP
jgi:hypothetical protein